MGITAVIENGYTIVKILESHGHHSNADALKVSVQVLESKGSDNGAFENIMSMCHAKWLGDLYIDSFKYHEWLKMLEKLRSKANKELNKDFKHS